MQELMTWKYMTDKMREVYGISEDSDEEFSEKELNLYMHDIWVNYRAEVFEKNTAEIREKYGRL